MNGARKQKNTLHADSLSIVFTVFLVPYLIPPVLMVGFRQAYGLVATTSDVYAAAEYIYIYIWR